MGRDVSNIIELLTGILEAQQELMPISEQKRQLLVDSKPEKLAELGAQEMKILSRINGLEKQRMRSMGEIGILLGKMPRSVTIEDLAGIALPEQRDVLLNLQHDILKAVEAQNAINKLNKTLLEAHIEYTEIMLDAFVGPDDDMTQYYDRTGNADLEGGARAGLFDAQA